jgi:ubiquitin carboxyl-terminal hydrolase 9/24
MGMRDNEIKELDKDSLANFLKQFKAFLLLSKSESEIAEIIENIQIKFASRFLNTTYLEKRLKGVADVRSLIERVNARISIAR